MRLGQRQADARARVELGVAARRVGGDGHAAAGLLVDAQHAGVGVLRGDGVAAHVAVVLLGDVRARAQRRRGGEVQHGLAQLVRRRRAGQLRVRLQRVLPLRAGVRAVVGRALVGDGLRRGVDDRLAAVGDDQVGAVGDHADVGRDDVPLGADGHELVHVLRLHHGAHALLGLRRQDLRCGHVLRTQVHVVQVDLHAAVAGGRQLRHGAGQARAAEVLDADDDAGLVQVEAALDEHLLGERVTDLDGRQLALRALLEGVRRQHRHAADAVEARAGAEEHDAVAGARRERQVQVLDRQHADAQRIDQGVAGVGLVEDGLAADVRQAQAVAVAADAGDDAGQHALRVRGVGRAEAQLVHHGDRAGAHGHDVADDAADAGGGALIRLDVGRVVVGLDLEGDGPAVADVDDAGVLADAGEHLLLHRVGRGLAEVAQVHLRRLVGAVLGPHDGVHGQLGVGGAAAEDLADAGVLVLLQSQLGPGLIQLGGGGGVVDGVVVDVDVGVVGHVGPPFTRRWWRRRTGTARDRRATGRSAPRRRAPGAA